MTEYNSKHGLVSKSPFELYMSFVDMRNFLQMLPEDKREGITADFDTITGTVQGMTLGVRVLNRHPYSRIDFTDNGGPVRFSFSLYFDASNEASKTDFYIRAQADLPMMVKMMVGSKIQKALDKVVDSLVDISEGRMPEGVDPEKLKDLKF
ncbi:MAG: hypothetical protein MJZ09_06305 [Bacteroidales bacterium]|nr:hypothetical protein [Bacteroidales bacterium]